MVSKFTCLLELHVFMVKKKKAVYHQGTRDTKGKASFFSFFLLALCVLVVKTGMVRRFYVMMQTCPRFQPGLFVRGKTGQCIDSKKDVYSLRMKLSLLTQRAPRFSCARSQHPKRMEVLR